MIVLAVIHKPSVPNHCNPLIPNHPMTNGDTASCIVQCGLGRFASSASFLSRFANCWRISDSFATRRLSVDARIETASDEKANGGDGMISFANASLLPLYHRPEYD